jgi:hypothetical protein
MIHDKLRQKREAPRIFKRFLLQIRDLACKLQRVRIGNDYVLMNVEFTSLLGEFGIAMQRTAPYAH